MNEDDNIYKTFLTTGLLESIKEGVSLKLILFKKAERSGVLSELLSLFEPGVVLLSREGELSSDGGYTTLDVVSWGSEGIVWVQSFSLWDKEVPPTCNGFIYKSFTSTYKASVEGESCRKLVIKDEVNRALSEEERVLLSTYYKGLTFS